MNWRKLLKPFRPEDPRVTAPMIVWWMIFVVLGVVFLCIAIQTVLISRAFPGQLAAMVATLTGYLIFVCLCIAGAIWLVWRQSTGKPLRAIAPRGGPA